MVRTAVRTEITTPVTIAVTIVVTTAGKANIENGTKLTSRTCTALSYSACLRLRQSQRMKLRSIYLRRSSVKLSVALGVMPHAGKPPAP